MQQKAVQNHNRIGHLRNKHRVWRIRLRILRPEHCTTMSTPATQTTPSIFKPRCWATTLCVRALSFRYVVLAQFQSNQSRKKHVRTSRLILLAVVHTNHEQTFTLVPRVKISRKILLMLWRLIVSHPVLNKYHCKFPWQIIVSFILCHKCRAMIFKVYTLRLHVYMHVVCYVFWQKVNCDKFVRCFPVHCDVITVGPTLMSTRIVFTIG